jgi:hypothetical protein
MFDWQSIVVALIILGALVYVARRGLSRLRSFGMSTKDDGAGCATGCGKCGEGPVAPTRPANVLVQLSSSRANGRRKAT